MHTQAVTAPSTSAAQATQALGKDDFLRLLIAQLRQQDPTKPVDGSEFIAQLAQFSALEQMHNVSLAVEELARRQEAAAAMSLAGKTVSVLDDQGATVTGTVQAVRRRDGKMVLVIDGREYPSANLVEVRA